MGEPLSGPPHICFLSSMHPARDKRVFDKEALSLLNAGFQVTHLCPGGEVNTEIQDGINIITYQRPKSIADRLTQLLKLYRLAKVVNADAYHCNEVDSWGVGVALKILRKKKCVFDVHEHYPSTFAESRFPKWANNIVAGCVRLVFNMFTPFTDNIVMAKQSVSDDFKIDSSKKTLVRNYTPKSALKMTEKVETDVKSETDDFTLIHLGLFNKLRGWPQALEALKLIDNPKVSLKVIGEINDGTHDEFMAQCEQLDLTRQVEVLDWMPFAQAFEHLQNADIGLILFQPNTLNHVYAMPHKMFDYMAAELAVILPDFAVEVAPVVKDTNCGLLVDPSDPKDIAEKIQMMISDPAQLRTYGENGKVAVQDRYNWEAEVARLIAMYENMFAVNGS